MSRPDSRLFPPPSPKRRCGPIEVVRHSDRSAARRRRIKDDSPQRHGDHREESRRLTRIDDPARGARLRKSQYREDRGRDRIQPASDGESGVDLSDGIPFPPQIFVILCDLCAAVVRNPGSSRMPAAHRRGLGEEPVDDWATSQRATNRARLSGWATSSKRPSDSNAARRVPAYATWSTSCSARMPPRTSFGAQTPMSNEVFT
jgi:hypothetical protein